MVPVSAPIPSNKLVRSLTKGRPARIFAATAAHGGTTTYWEPGVSPGTGAAGRRADITWRECW